MNSVRQGTVLRPDTIIYPQKSGESRSLFIYIHFPNIFCNINFKKALNIIFFKHCADNSAIKFPGSFKNLSSQKQGCNDKTKGYRNGFI